MSKIMLDGTVPPGGWRHFLSGIIGRVHSGGSHGLPQHRGYGSRTVTITDALIMALTAAGILQPPFGKNQN